jgi:hypothetical protein
MKIAISVFLFATFWGCSEGTSPNLGEAFDLKYGQTVQLSSNAEVLLKVSTTDLSGVYSLNTTLEPKLIDHDGYMLELVSVSPYPVYGEDISEQDYTIRISVTD